MQDIEDLVAVGKQDKICPYFFSRDNSENARLVLLPYNYLLDSSIRATLKIDWRDAVCIFDEAHNLERVASDASSFSLSATEIAGCISELQHVLRKLQSEEEFKSLVNKSEKLAGGNVSRPGIQSVVRILKSLFEIEKRIDGLALSRSGSIKTNSCVS